MIVNDGQNSPDYLNNMVGAFRKSTRMADNEQIADVAI